MTLNWWDPITKFARALSYSKMGRGLDPSITARGFILSMAGNPIALFYCLASISYQTKFLT